MNSYGRYQNIRNAAWRCLLDSRTDSLPVPVMRIARGMRVDLYEYAANTSLLRGCGFGSLLSAAGFAYMDPKGETMIFFDERLPRQEIRFTIAHELGHILLGHMGDGQPVGSVLSSNEPELERAADRFALRLLAPACVLWGKRIRSAGEIAAACDIPRAAAQQRARRMLELEGHAAWLKSPLEQALYQQFGFSQPPDGGFQ